MSRHRAPGQPHDPLVQIDEPDRAHDPLVRIDITLTLPRQIVWLLAGVAISHLYAFGGG